MMKCSILISIIITSFCSMVTAENAFSQILQKKISVKLDNVALSEAIDKISAAADVKFIFARISKDDKKVTLEAHNERLEEVLFKLLRPYGLAYAEIDRTIVLTHAEKRQPENVRGKIEDESGQQMPGVSILVKGSRSGTSSDENGEYSILAEDTDVLEFSFMGYETLEIPVNGQKVINAILYPSSGELDEVVVLGFGQTQKKIAQTGSTASIGTKELKQSPVANVTNALAGRLPGLITVQRGGEPGADAAALFLRGRATLNSTAPLITIDGVQKDYSAIGLLDPNEIENITILKDASATALYGVKGANGVIIITTRRGKEGKPSINIRVQRAVQTAIRLPNFANAHAFAMLRNEAYLNDNPGGTAAPFSAEALEAYRSGSDPYRYPDIDWVEEMMKSSNLLQANFDISGGTKQIRYFVNVGYTDQDGLLKLEKMDTFDPNFRYKRYNFRSNIDVDFNEDFSMSLNLFGAIEDKNSPRKSTSEIFDNLMWVPPVATPVKYPIGVYGLSSVYGGGNPIGDIQQGGYRQGFNSSLSGMLSATRKLDFITEGLYIKGNFSFDGYFINNLERSFDPYYAFYEGGDLMDTESYRFQGIKNGVLGPPWSSTTQSRDTWLDVSFNYQRSYGDHNFTGLLLANRQQRVISGQIPYVSQGLVGRLAYGYDNKYFAEINAGLNGTDNFAKENRYGFFPSFSAAWVLTQEDFLKENRIIDYLKIRASYGIVGNDQLTGRRWLFIGEFNKSGGYSFGDPPSFVEGVEEGPMANPFVTWETARKINVGLEIRLLRDLIGLNLDIFREARSDMLVTRGSIPSIIGVSPESLPPANMGETENKGFELELTHRKIISNRFTYFLNSNITLARNKVLFMDEENRAYPYLHRTGHPIGQIFGLTAAGFFQNAADIESSPSQFGEVIPGDLKYYDRNDDGKIDLDDEGAIGRSDVPELFYGISAGINWKNLDVSFLLQGGDRFNVMFSGRGAWEFQNGGKVLQSHLGRWTPESAESATYPAIHSGTNANNHRSSTFFLKDAGYLRLKNVEIGYTFGSQTFIKAAGLSALRIYANGINLHTWDKIGGDFDPEAPSGSGAIYPQQRVINVGLSVNF